MTTIKKNPAGRLELTWAGKNLALIPHEDGKYDYAWVEPDDPRVTEARSIDVNRRVGSTESMRGDDGEMVAAGADDNLLIVGDSGDVLRSLGTIPEWQERYLGQVKLVYIDPPFNTGQTFEQYSDQMEHSVWLTFMRDRIRDIKPLMAPDASIWVHLDDVEVHRMRAMLDEEFGPNAFVAEVVWEKLYARKSNNDSFSSNHDTILVYKVGDPAFNRLVAGDMSDRYTNRDDDPRGPWQSVSFSVRTEDPARRVDYRYEVELPSGRKVGPPPGRHWNGKLPRYERMKEEGLLWFGADGDSRPREKMFLSEEDLELIPFTIWKRGEVGDNDEAKKGLRSTLGSGDVFATPKPERLLERVVHIGSNPGDLVLDCFAGSGTTAAVAQKMGRRWVTVELLQSTVATFTEPRLAKVVDGSDRGGISTSSGRIAGDGVELPEGMAAEDAQTFQSALNKVAGEVELRVDVAKEAAKMARAAKKAGGSELSDEELLTVARLLSKLSKTSDTEVDVTSSAATQLRAATKTRDERTVRWSGGGGFTVARLGPSMYDVDDETGMVFLSEHATNGAWSAAVAGQLGFIRTPDDPMFAGMKGRQRLAVIDGVVDVNAMDRVVEALGDGEKAVVVGKSVLSDARAHLTELSPGSIVRTAPDGVLRGRRLR